MSKDKDQPQSTQGDTTLARRQTQGTQPTALDQHGVTGNEPSAGTLQAGTATDPKTDAARLEERDKTLLEQAPQYVKDAAARSGGSVPIAAPKGGEGVRVAATTSTAVPELEPPPAPPEYRAAPTAPGADAPSREQWPAGGVSYDDVQKLDQLRVRTRDPLSAPIMVGGVMATREGVTVEVSQVRARGGRNDTHLHALLSDPRVEVARVDTKKT